MNNYIEFVQKYRKYLLVLFIILMIFAILGVRQLNINANFDIFKLVDSEHQDVLDEMTAIFGESNQTILMVESKLDDIDKDLSETDALLNQLIPNNYVSPNSFLDLSEKSDINAIINKLGSLSPIVIKDDKAYLSYVLKLPTDYEFDILFEALDANSNTYYVSGNAYMQFEILNMISSILLLIPPIAMILVLLTFRSQLHSFKAALLSVLPAGIAALWTLGLAGWIGGEVSIMTVLAPIFAIVIGSADGLHFISHMEDEIYSNKSNKEALVKTLTLVGMPMMITTTTSIAGFLGLLLIDTAAIKDLAIFASVGIFLAGLVTWYVLPLIFTGSLTIKTAAHKDMNQLIEKVWGKPSYIIIAIITVISLTLIPRINTEFNQLMFFKDSNVVQKNFESIIDINGGAIPVYYYGSTTLKEQSNTLNNLDKMLSDLEKETYVSKVMNPIPLIDLSQPPSLAVLNQAKEFIRIEGDTIYYRMMIFPKDLSNESLDKIVMKVSEYDALNGRLAGMQFLMKEMNVSMVEGQLKSIFFTLLLIIIMLLISLRSIKLTLIACLPIILTSIILYGFLGLSNISLNVTTATIFSISLGIGIDYAIHYISIYKYHKDHNHVTPRQEALKYSSRPIIANAFGLSLGMTALWLSPLLLHQHISSLMWVAMIASVLISLTLIPSLLKND